MVFSVASLLIQLRPGEKRQRGRWRPGWGHQEGPGRGWHDSRRAQPNGIHGAAGGVSAQAASQPDPVSWRVLAEQ